MFKLILLGLILCVIVMSFLLFWIILLTVALLVFSKRGKKRSIPPRVIEEPS